MNFISLNECSSYKDKKKNETEMIPCPGNKVSLEDISEKMSF